MQNKRKTTSLLFVLISFIVASQDMPPVPGPPPPVGLPIDGGVMLGVCVAIFYGAKKLL